MSLAVLLATSSLALACWSPISPQHCVDCTLNAANDACKSAVLDVAANANYRYTKCYESREACCVHVDDPSSKCSQQDVKDTNKFNMVAVSGANKKCDHTSAVGAEGSECVDGVVHVDGSGVISTEVSDWSNFVWGNAEYSGGGVVVTRADTPKICQDTCHRFDACQRWEWTGPGGVSATDTYGRCRLMDANYLLRVVGSVVDLDSLSVVDNPLVYEKTKEDLKDATADEAKAAKPGVAKKDQKDRVKFTFGPAVESTDGVESTDSVVAKKVSGVAKKAEGNEIVCPMAAATAASTCRDGGCLKTGRGLAVCVVRSKTHVSGFRENGSGVALEEQWEAWLGGMSEATQSRFGDFGTAAGKACTIFTDYDYSVSVGTDYGYAHNHYGTNYGGSYYGHHYADPYYSYSWVWILLVVVLILAVTGGVACVIAGKR